MSIRGILMAVHWAFSGQVLGKNKKKYDDDTGITNGIRIKYQEQDGKYVGFKAVADT